MVGHGSRRELVPRHCETSVFGVIGWFLLHFNYASTNWLGSSTIAVEKLFHYLLHRRGNGQLTDGC
jgi:hypothetical protein